MKTEVLGVQVENATMEEALDLLERWRAEDGPTRCVYFVNAHTLNLASEDPAYRDVLNRADVVFGDGTGVRWAARLRGVEMRDNVNGTDLTPALFERSAGRLYLLGATPEANAAAVAHCRRAFPKWEIAGAQHGYYDKGEEDRVIDAIREARPDLLLVAFGNPLQERFIDRHRDRLGAKIAMGVGGLFDYWAGNLVRAPQVYRDLGMEWVHILMRQPYKARRYLLGNPLFLCRAVSDRIANGPAH